MNKIYLNQPVKPNLKKLFSYLEKINETGFFTNFGPLHAELTDRLEDYLGVRNLLLVSNGTVALQVAAKALGSKSIISTPFSFVATASAFKWLNLPIQFVDIDRYTYNLCPKEVNKFLAIENEADSIVATHVYGNPCDVKGFESVGETGKKKVIYDAAHAFGVKLDGRSVLLHGDASTLSFHATKVFHTIEGGAVIFKDKENRELAEKLINFGIDKTIGEVSGCGINAKLSEYNAAVGLVLLDQIDTVLEKREDLYYQYSNALNGVVELQKYQSKATHNGAYFPVRFSTIEELKKVQDALSENHIQSRAYFSPSITDALKLKEPYDLVNTKEIAGHVLCLPLHFYLEPEHVQKVIDVIKMCDL